MSRINFYNVDCVQFMKDIPDNYYFIGVIDPPYGIGENGDKNSSRSKIATSKDYKAYHGCDEEPPSKEYFKELFRVTKHQIIWGANHFIENLPIQNTSCWIVWDKDNGETDFADCELAWTSFNSAVRKFKWRWQGMLQQNMKNKQQRIHPNEKPIELYRWMANEYKYKGLSVLDTHGGSFSHAIAADMEGFDLDIMDIDKFYFDAGVNRFNQYKRQLTLF